jgi:hypothetical protein
MATTKPLTFVERVRRARERSLSAMVSAITRPRWLLICALQNADDD